MSLPKLIVLDRDNTINYASSDPTSPLYYITRVEDLVIKAGVHEAIGLIKAHGIPVVLVTKQRCVGKGIISRETLNLIHARLQRVLDLTFEDIYVEENAEDKSTLYAQILERGVAARDISVFDDSAREHQIAASLGMGAYDGVDLLAAVKTVFNIS